MLGTCYSFSIFACSFPSYVLSPGTMPRFSFHLVVLMPVQSPTRDTIRIQPHRFIVVSFSFFLFLWKLDSQKEETMGNFENYGGAEGMFSISVVVARRVASNSAIKLNIGGQPRVLHSLISETSKRDLFSRFHLSSHLLFSSSILRTF